MRRLYSLFLGFLFTLPTFAQQRITGVVTSSEDGLPIIGAAVTVKGTSQRAATNVEGTYTIEASKGQVLLFSYVGMKPQERTVGETNTINITLDPATEQLEELVVTAMGVKMEKKKLNFAVQSVDADALTEGRQANFINGLQGKVSGINVTNAGGSPNSGSLLIIRGISSINSAQSNAPLYVLDGVAFSGSVADINPNDIENITILKGAAASALYGQSGANGAVLITTKQAQAGRLAVSANISLQDNRAIRLPQMQTKFGPGALGFYRQQEIGGYGGWGPMLTPNEQVFDNVRNYFRPGFYQKYDVSVSGGTDKLKAYTSAFYSAEDGIVVNDYLKKFGLLFKATYDINNKLTLSGLANITNDTYRGGGSLSSVYAWPITDDIRQYQDKGRIKYRYISELNKINSPVSPLWGRYMDKGVNTRLHNTLQGAINYKAFRNFEAIGRIIYDINQYNYDGYSTPRFDDSVILPNPPHKDDKDSSGNLKYPNLSTDATVQQRFEEDTQAYAEMYNKSPYLNQMDYAKIDKDLLGQYSHSNSTGRMLTLMGLVTYKVPLPKEFSLDLLLGSEFKERNSMESSLQGRDFVVPGIYNISNVKEILGVRDVSLRHQKRRNAGVFGEMRADYKGIASLSLTSRWDWSSTLSQEYSPYFYPSVTGGLIFSELLELQNDWFSYGKARANWARVGKDTPAAYLFDRRYIQLPTFPDGGYVADPTKATARVLMPEMTDSWEVGMDLRFFNSKTRFDMAYYETITDNQIVTVRVSPSTGYILQVRNEGTVKNYGVELQLEQDIITNKNLRWTATLNWGFNRGTVVALPEGMTEIQGSQYSDVFPVAFLHGSTTAISGKDYLRTPDGKVIVNAEGYPRINPAKGTLIGNREPDFSMGLHNSLRMGNLSLAFLIDGRKGGDVYNNTARGLWGSGQHKALEFYRGRQIVWDGVVEQPDGSYKQNTTPIVLDNKTITEYYAGVSSNFVEDGSYIRLNYVTVGYDLSSLVRGKTISGLRLSLTGSNLLLLTKYTGSNPQINANTSSGGTGGMGIDNYPVPTTRGINLTINATF